MREEILTKEELEAKHYDRMMEFLIADFEGKDFNECDIILRQIIKVAYELLNEPDVMKQKCFVRDRMVCRFSCNFVKEELC